MKNKCKNKIWKYKTCTAQIYMQTFQKFYMLSTLITKKVHRKPKTYKSTFSKWLHDLHK